jgi:hypothetical protein
VRLGAGVFHYWDCGGDFLEELADSFANDYDAFDINDHAALVKIDENETSNINHELDLQIDQMVEKNEGLWKCKVCGRTAKHKSMIKRHTEIHAQCVTHACHVCNKSLSTRNSLKTRIIDVHSKQLFSCNIVGRWKMQIRNNKTVWS